MSGWRTGSRVVVGHGARAVEARLLAEAGKLLDEAAGEPALLRTPVRIVVPSRSLRLHVSERLVAARGRGVAGVVVRTLYGLAVEIISRAGERAPRGDALFPILVRRVAEAEPLLNASFTPLVDGWGALVASVRDLVDAGLGEHHADAVEERLEELGGGADVERARAIVRVASAVQVVQRRLGTGRSAEVLARAAELVRSAPETVLPARAVFIHGFAEATGVASDLLEAILVSCPTMALIDEPRDCVDPGRIDLGVAFVERLRDRLCRLSPLEREDAEPPAAAIETIRAAGTETEVRDVGFRIRSLLDAGIVPERIGVVARTLEPYRLALERHFGRLGIPFSCSGALGSWAPAGRRLRALLDLLRLGANATTDAWLSAGALEGEAGLDLGLGLRACGAGRLADVAALVVDDVLDTHGGLPLPARRGIEVIDDGADGETRVAPRRRLGGRLLRRAVERASACCELTGSWNAAGELAVHLARLRRIVDRGLAWARHEAVPGWGELDDAVGRLVDDVPRGLPLSREEFVDLLAGELEDVGRAALGGSGAGVQVMGVVEARGWTFEHLFVLGLNRDLFPRPVREDSLLPDRLRGALAVVLPDLSLKLAGFDEERYLFAQLVSSSPNVTLAWRISDDDGRPCSPSPLLQRLQLGCAAPRTGEPRAGIGRAARGPRTAFEHAVEAGLSTDRGRFAAILSLARAEVRESGGADPETFARARLAVLDEQAPDLATAEGRSRRFQLGPYHGFVGAPRSPGDPRGALFVTVAANVVACPWQTFLGRLLRLEEAPDPLLGLPAIGPLAVGSLVHTVLERICQGGDGELPHDVAAALDRPPLAVAWPAEAELERLLEGCATAVAREEGLVWPGMRLLLRERARPYLAVARAEDWPEGRAVAVCAVEAEGVAAVVDARGERREIRFRADRVDRTGDTVRLTDYKTGRAPDLGVRELTQSTRLRRQIRSGRLLQGAAYAASCPGAAQGRYLYLSPKHDRRSPRAVVIDASDDAVRSEFVGTIRAVLDVWDLGAFFPRLVEPDRDVEPERCRWCPFRPACWRGDSGARARLRGWVDRQVEGSTGGGAPSSAERAWLNLWLSGAAVGGDPGDGAEEGE